jgi:hypothetical protein
MVAYLAGKQAVLDLPRWKFFLVILLGIVVGNIVRDLLVFKYSLPHFAVFALSLSAAVLAGLLCGFVLRRGSRPEIP